VPPINELLQNAFASHGLADELYLVSSISPALLWVLCSLTILFTICMLWLTIRFILYFRKIRSKQKAVDPLLLTLLIYSLFFCFWMPEILEFWILQMVLLWILLIGTLPVKCRRVKMPCRDAVAT